ncbi:helix-turn-helix domain-containing protein [Emcibacter sp.]|uniref:helix-turn-helix domain-containing protein n=1 Tax=Emcibacter sp. TaxID=1979954 RepID=UPI003A943C19
MIENMTTKTVDHVQKVGVLKSLLDRTFCTTEVGMANKRQSCNSDIFNVQMGNINVLKYISSGQQTAKRTLNHIRRDQDDHYILYMPVNAQITIEQNGQLTRMTPGSFAFVHTGKPFMGSVTSCDGSEDTAYVSLHARVPAPFLRERLPFFDQYCNRLFTFAPGASQIMASTLKDILKSSHLLTDVQKHYTRHILLETIRAAAEEAVHGLENGLPGPKSMRAMTLEKVQDFIQANLSNPSLTTGLIAEKCHISMRYLHAVFEETGWTAAAWVKEQRLLKCRQALKDPSQARLSVTEIAFRWGFNDASHFSRAYKARFDSPPSADRCRS